MKLSGGILKAANPRDFLLITVNTPLDWTAPLKALKPAIALFAILTLFTDAIYPALITALAQILFSGRANSSLFTDGQGKTVGSELIGKSFGD